jgi:hypothetical protein
VNRLPIGTSIQPLRLVKALLPALMALLTAACLVLPVRTTYYEPNALDGTLEQTTGVSKRKDTVGRAVDGLAVHVRADSTPGNAMTVGIHLSWRDEAIEVNPNLIELQAAADGTTFQALSVSRRNARSDESHRSSDWITLTFPDSAAANDIAVVFAAGAVKKNGTDLPLNPFRFTRVSKWNAHVY